MRDKKIESSSKLKHAMNVLLQGDEARKAAPLMVVANIDMIRQWHFGHNFSTIEGDGDLIHKLECKTCNTVTELWRG